MSEKAPEDSKPQVDAKPEPGDQINIKVRDAEGNEVQFKIKKTTQLKKLMDAYCLRMGTAKGAYRFLFDGHRINEEDTPESLDMQELDCVDAMVSQLGG
ncbi:Small ubiquitin-related modifier 2 [Gracilariopsis chorda]|uniref:Small ubiquitin-related modifier 2 n=1 Tax=Gracilariopsis chorda TaxID=448386 RepID=A0A2V3J1G9_9FLOR|nr:Small ubiquitin-related modifier 2 [Gracilariopsis chorda]|eukprot:PXF48224.1 Small ubiquitin-related modifier 2 [Gracilariopsis chorda]